MILKGRRFSEFGFLDGLTLNDGYSNQECLRFLIFAVGITLHCIHVI